MAYTQPVALDIPAIQAALQADGLDGWLLYDFHGSNPIARAVAQVDSTTKLTTRRWYYLIPATGEPRSLMHTIEPTSLAHLPGAHSLYAGHQQLQDGLSTLVTECAILAMEYSPNGAIPYVSRVDAGTVDAIRALGVRVVSSGDLVQRFEAVWDEAALATHQAASDRLYRIKDRTFALISERLESATPVTEFEVQQAMVGWFRDAELVTDSPPVVASQQSSGNPHYLPTAQQCRPIERGNIVLLDLWGKMNTPGAVFADITWMGWAGADVPPQYAAAFDLACAARDAAVARVKNASATGEDLRGWQVDQAARAVIDTAGMGQFFVHRTGHSLGEAVHGNGVHMDDYETHDDRRLLPGTGFTIEPGIYQETFGVRTEINMYVGRHDAQITGPVQTAIVPLASDRGD